MKIKPLFLTVCMSVAVTICAKATLIPISNHGFEGLSASFSFPLVGVANNTLGAWNFQLSDLVAVSGSVQIGTTNALGGGTVPAPVQGTNEVAIKFPLGVVVGANISQTLSSNWLPNSTYTLKVYLASSTTASLLSGTTLSLKSGTGTEASSTTNSLLGLFAVSNVYQPVTLTYKTGNTAPTGPIGIAFDFPNVLQLGGNIYVDNASLTVVPNDIQVTTTTSSSGPGGRKLNMAGAGGAPFQNYNILTSTNILLVSSNWATWSSAQFDASGNFTQQITINTNEPYRFFRVQLPSN